MHQTVLTAVFLALAGWFLVGSGPADIPLAERNVVTLEMVQPTTLRTPLGPNPTIIVGGVKKTCQTCHEIWDSGVRQNKSLVQHLDTWLSHGENDNCLSCHNREDRGMLSDREGNPIPFGDSAALCSQCHGPTWRDWQSGAHGRTNGYWDKSKGEQVRQQCVACHDPHHPAFPQLETFPAPNTLRQITDEHAGDHVLEGPIGRFREVIRSEREAKAEANAKEAAAKRAALDAKYKELGIERGEK